MSDGSAPRVRGTGNAARLSSSARRFSPARAGNSVGVAGLALVAAVQPRACGEQCCDRRQTDMSIGSAPRVRGTGDPERAAASGSRFSPARAGNRPRCCLRRRAGSVQPRACGEQIDCRGAGPYSSGSAPRVRGTANGITLSTPIGRFSPARAGNSHDRFSLRRSRSVQPRACGEQLMRLGASREGRGSAPRVRGTGERHCSTPSLQRFSPARAGNSSRPLRSGPHAAVQPRACGEQDPVSATTSPDVGSAPRVRGTALAFPVAGCPSRFSPARAGNRRATTSRTFA